METARGHDLGETINNIRKQYEKAAQKNREETEAWYQTKVRDALIHLLPDLSWMVICTQYTTIPKL